MLLLSQFKINQSSHQNLANMVQNAQQKTVTSLTLPLRLLRRFILVFLAITADARQSWVQDTFAMNAISTSASNATRLQTTTRNIK